MFNVEKNISKILEKDINSKNRRFLEKYEPKKDKKYVMGYTEQGSTILGFYFGEPTFTINKGPGSYGLPVSWNTLNRKVDITKKVNKKRWREFEHYYGEDNIL
jgi:hypothetical protein